MRQASIRTQQSQSPLALFTLVLVQKCTYTQRTTNTTETTFPFAVVVRPLSFLRLPRILPCSPTALTTGNEGGKTILNLIALHQGERKIATTVGQLFHPPGRSRKNVAKLDGVVDQPPELQISTLWSTSPSSIGGTNGHHPLHPKIFLFFFRRS